MNMHMFSQLAQGSARRDQTPAVAGAVRAAPRHQAPSSSSLQPGVRQAHESMTDERLLNLMQRSPDGFLADEFPWPGSSPVSANNGYHPPPGQTSHFVGNGYSLQAEMQFGNGGISLDGVAMGAVGGVYRGLVPSPLPTPERYPSPYSEGSHVADKCHRCGYEDCTYNHCFSDPKHLWKHIQKNHVIGGPFECNWHDCNYDVPFATKHTLWRHIQNKHVAPGRFECKDCGNKFNRKDKLRDHARSVHVREHCL